MSTVFVLDTSYMMELYAVPTYSEPAAVEAVRSRFRRELSVGATLVLPIGVIYETGNHIGDVRAEAQRCALARRFQEDVRTSATDRMPWLLAPSEPIPEILQYLEAFATTSVYRAARGKGSLGLVDTQVREVAHHWKTKPGYRVHIWTRDQRLKREEPDPEPNAFV